MMSSVELIDVINRDGSPTGVTKPKPDIHRDGDWHRAVHVWVITPDHRVLVQRRARVKENNPGLWDVSCAGHISAGENTIDAAIREAEEELGLTLHASDLEYVTSMPSQCVLNDGKYIDNEIHEIYVARRDVELSALRLQPEEVDDARLVTWAEFERMKRVAHGDEYRLIEKRTVHHRDTEKKTESTESSL